MALNDKQQRDTVPRDAFSLSKELGADGCITVIAAGIGCIAVCVDHTHADYVIKALRDGRYRIGVKGVEVVQEKNQCKNS